MVREERKSTTSDKDSPAILSPPSSRFGVEDYICWFSLFRNARSSAGYGTGRSHTRRKTQIRLSSKRRGGAWNA